MTVSNGQPNAAELKARLREKPLSELTEEFEQLSSMPDCDIDLLCAYLDVLEEKAPVLPDGYEPAAEYEKFRDAHAELFNGLETEKAERPAARKGGLLRLRQVLVTFAAVFCLVVFVADANGAGVIDRLIEWGTEIFILRPASGVMELPSADENGFLSLQEALEHYGVEDAAIPTWIPSRYSINGITALESNDMTIISGKYIADSNTLFIRATIDRDEEFAFEKDAVDNHNLYTAKGITFILSANLEEERAVWTAGGYVYSISGDITEEELKEMLDSIQIKE